VLTLLGALLYFMVFPSEFTLDSYLTQMATLPVSPKVFWIVQLLLMMVAPLLNVATCFGEEWGWRGYLLPKVAQRMKFLPTVLPPASSGVSGTRLSLWPGITMA
jgi:membrane protease YdiL (CAAX protease family)